MSDINEQTEQDVFLETVEKLSKFREEVTFLLQMQDLANCEKTLRQARVLFKNVRDRLAPDENIYISVFIDQMQTSVVFTKAILAQSDEEMAKAMENLNIANMLCQNVETELKNLSAEGVGAFGEDLQLFKILAFYYNNVVAIVTQVVEKSLEKASGKFVDEAETYRKASINLKNLDFMPFFSENEEMNVAVDTLLRFVADISQRFEKRADLILRKREKIEYLDPVDRKVFIIHGHNEGALLELKDILIKDFQVNPVILRDERDGGRTVIEKFEHYGRACAYAFALITRDDLVKIENSDYYQARPNVLFELGWFCGRFGRSRVRIICQKNTNLPSDLGGLIAHEFDQKIKEVYVDIREDLEESGLIDKD